MEYLLSLVVAIVGDVIAYFIIKWLDSNNNRGN